LAVAQPQRVDFVHSGEIGTFHCVTSSFLRQSSRLGAPLPTPPNYHSLSRISLDRLVVTGASTCQVIVQADQRQIGIP
jgi:hypothetical protein